MEPVWVELKRRNVFRVGVAYAVVAWLLIQVTDTVLPTFGAPEWVAQSITFLLIVGMPVAITLAWAYELTPEGIRRTKALPLSESINKIKGRKADFAIIGLLALAVAYLVIDDYIFEEHLAEPAAFSAEDTANSAGSAYQEPGESLLPNSVAVLPFANLSPDPDNAYFAAGVHESILNQLAKIEDMHVIARTSMLRYADGQKSIPEIARELRVQAVMEGSVRYADDRVLVTAQLIDPRTSAHLWSREYDLPLDDIFAIQTDVAIRIARALAAELSINERQSIEKVPTGSPVAYQFYLRGRYHWDIGRREDIAESIEYYRQALRHDSEFALAYAGLADAYTILSGMGAGSTAELMPQAKRAADRALELDPTLSEAYVARALTRYFFDWDFEAGDRDFVQAIALSPNSASAHQFYGKNLPVTLRFDEGIAETERALELNPYSVHASKDLGETLYFARRYDEAIARFEQTLELEPGFPSAYFWLVRCYEATGRWDEAIDIYLRNFESAPQNATQIPMLKETYRTLGWEGFWRQRLTAINRRAAQEYIEPFRFVEFYVRVGDADAAFQWLEKSLDTRSIWISTFHIDPLLDSIRSDPRFANLLRRAGLERWSATTEIETPR